MQEDEEELVGVHADVQVFLWRGFQGVELVVAHERTFVV